MTDHSTGSDDSTLYSSLAEPAPPSTEGGDTLITAAKETVDRDREDAEATILRSER